MKKSHSESLKERKAARTAYADSIGRAAYNGIIGLTILYGFIVNALMVVYARPFFEGLPLVAVVIGYFVCCIAGTVIANKSSKPALSFLGYNLIVLPIAMLLSLVLPISVTGNIFLAALLTGIVTVIMIILSVIFPSFFSKLGPSLFSSLLIGSGVEIIATLLGYGGNIFNWLFVVIFSLYIGYDWHRAQSYAKTVDNAIDSAIDLYLDLINLFLRILDLLDN
jgi:FtsH-binding integral membrane protein